MFNAKDYILIVENVITDALSKTILDEYEKSNEWVNTTIASGTNREIRKCDAIDMSNQNIIKNNETVRKTIDNYLYIASSFALNEYKKHYEKLTDGKKFISVQGDSGYTLLRYQENEFYKEHTDHFLQQPRILSCSFVLNDDYEGGEFAFFDRELKYKLPKGAAIMFPSNFMYPHEIMPVTRKVRYSIITWFI